MPRQNVTAPRWPDLKDKPAPLAVDSAILGAPVITGLSATVPFATDVLANYAPWAQSLEANSTYLIKLAVAFDKAGDPGKVAVDVPAGATINGVYHYDKAGSDAHIARVSDGTAMYASGNWVLLLDAIVETVSAGTMNVQLACGSGLSATTMLASSFIALQKIA